MNQQDLNAHTQQNKQLWQYLQNLNNNEKQRSSHMSINSPKSLQQQLNMLSSSYKNSQQKLLQLQKQLYHETLYNQKQRSIIEILKYVINENFDDQTLLTYISNLYQENGMGSTMEKQGAKKYQIKAELEQIKEMILNRKSSNRRSDSLKEGTIIQLKKQIKKHNKMKKQLMQDLDQMLNEKQELANEIMTVKNDMNQQKREKEEILSKLVKAQKQIEQNKRNIEELTKHSKQLQESLTVKNEQEYRLMKKMTNFLSSMPSDQSENKAENEQRDKSTKNYQFNKIISKLCSKLNKYRNLAKQLSQKAINDQKNKQLLTLFRFFIPQQGQQILQQFENSSNTEKDCLVKQLSDLGKLHRKKLNQMQKCQQQLWSLKVRCLRDQQQQCWSKSRSNSRTSPNTMLRQPTTQKLDKQNLEPNMHNENNNWHKTMRDNDIRQFLC